MTLDPLPGPTSPHRLTSWGDADGQRRRRCSCGREDGATFGCLQYAALSRLLDQAASLIRAAGVARSSWMPAACWTPAARRTRGLVYLALVVAAGELEQEEAAGPVSTAGRDARRDVGPPGIPTVARAVPAAEPETTRPAEQLPAGYVRVRWVCGHSAAGPGRHGWADHRHPCPECNRYPLDRRCPGVAWTDPRVEPLAIAHGRRCAVCQAPARLYPAGSLCDVHAPWAAAGRPDPTLDPLPRTPAPPARLEAV